MNIENFEYLKIQLEKRSWEHLIPELTEQMTAGHPTFDLYTESPFEGKQVDYELQFKKHSEHDFYYFNRINAVMSEGENVIAEASFKESWKLMPEEMSRILSHGSKVAVYKEGIKNDSGEAFNAWITVNVDQPITEKGQLNLNTYHDKYYHKYPFDLDTALNKLPEHILNQIKDKVRQVKQDLIHGIPIPVQVYNGIKREPGFISINAKVGRLEILDVKMEILPLPEKMEQQQLPKESGQEQKQESESEKKKPWQNQSIKANPFKNKQNKGLSR